MRVHEKVDVVARKNDDVNIQIVVEVMVNQIAMRELFILIMVKAITREKIASKKISQIRMLFSVTSAKTMVILQRIARQNKRLIFKKKKMNVQKFVCCMFFC